jgi:hypothetical protein
MDPGRLDHGAHGLTMPPALEYSEKSWCHHAAGARRQNRDLRAISASHFNYCQAVV